MSTLPLSFDNPLFVKHVRSRLRKGQALAPVVVVGSVCLLVAYSGYVNNWIKSGWTFGIYVTIQVVALGMMGAAQISSAVGGARESGILDFHRVSPLSPLAVTLGFFFGAPIREYVLAGMTLPFVLYCVAEDAPDFSGAVQTEVATLLGCWLIHAIALLTSLASKKPKAGTKGAVGVLVFVMIIFSSAQGFRAMGSIAQAVGESPKLGFFTIPLPWLAFTLLYGLPSLFFLLLASVRKMRSERAHVYTKPEAVAVLAVEALLILGAIWDMNELPFLPLFVAYATAALALVLILTATPNLGEFTKGVRRAEREGKARLGPWDELALNRVAVLALCAIVLVAPTVAWYFVSVGPFPQWSLPPGGGPPRLAISISVAVLAVATFGLALQFFLLRAPRRGATLLGLFIFAAWILPPAVGAILAATRANEGLAVPIIATSPIAGIGMAAAENFGPEISVDAVRFAALVPTLVFALLFNNAVTFARRRAVAAIHGGKPLAKPEDEPDQLAD